MLSVPTLIPPLASAESTQSSHTEPGPCGGPTVSPRILFDPCGVTVIYLSGLASALGPGIHRKSIMGCAQMWGDHVTPSAQTLQGVHVAQRKSSLGHSVHRCTHCPCPHLHASLSLPGPITCFFLSSTLTQSHEPPFSQRHWGLRCSGCCQPGIFHPVSQSSSPVPGTA